MTKIMHCMKCVKHVFQDSKYGDKMRVFNVIKVKERSEYRCTVCGDKKVGE